MRVQEFNLKEKESLRLWIKNNKGTDFISNDTVRKIFLLKDIDIIIGYIAFNVVSPEAEVLYLLIDEGYRNKGLGYRLLNETLNILKDNGVSKCFLEVDTDNLYAYKLYKKLDFKEISRRIKYYDNGHDSIVMEKEL